MVNVGTNNHSDISGGGNGTLTNTGKLEAEQATAAANFNGFNLTKDGKDKDAVWRIYEGKTMPLLTAFMQRKDKITIQEYDGTAQVGQNITAASDTLTSEHLSELYGVELHLVYVDEVDRMACVSAKL